MSKSAFFKIVALCLAVGGWGSGPVEAADEAAGIEISKRDCRRVTAHMPSGDVAFKPGVDARGRAVAPADLAGSRIIETPTTITIPLTLDIEDLFGLPSAVSGAAPIGTVEYDIGSGKLLYNGEALTDPQMAAIAAACAELKK